MALFVTKTEPGVMTFAATCRRARRQLAPFCAVWRTADVAIRSRLSARARVVAWVWRKKVAIVVFALRCAGGLRTAGAGLWVVSRAWWARPTCRRRKHAFPRCESRLRRVSCLLELRRG